MISTILALVLAQAGPLAAPDPARATATAAQSPAPTATFTAPQRLAGESRRQPHWQPAGGVDASGRALLVWDETISRRESRIVAASAAPGEPFGPPQRLGRGFAPEPAIGPDGRAVIAYTSPRGAELVAGDTSGRFGPPVLLSRKRRPSAAVMAGDGTAAVVSANVDKGSTVHLVAPDGRAASVRRFDPYRPDGASLVAEDGSAGFGEGELAAGADGTIALVTNRGLLERRPGERTFAHQHRPLARRFADPRVAVSPAGDVAVVAVDRPLCIGEYGCVGAIALAERAAGAARFAAPVRAPVKRYRVDEGRETIAAGFSPLIAYGTTGPPLIVWSEDERVCTECDIDMAEGPLVLWAPGRGRTVLSAEPAFTQLVPVADGVAYTLERASGKPELWFVGTGDPSRAGSLDLPLGYESSLLTGGGARLLQAQGGPTIRAALGEVRR